jgi:hypothetical protein
MHTKTETIVYEFSNPQMRYQVECSSDQKQIHFTVHALDAPEEDKMVFVAWQCNLLQWMRTQGWRPAFIVGLTNITFVKDPEAETTDGVVHASELFQRIKQHLDNYKEKVDQHEVANPTQPQSNE